MAHQIIPELLELNRAQSELYLQQTPSRKAYRAKHPTMMVAFKCMDGRVHLPVMTRTPFGMIRPKRNIGGIFNMGWPALRSRVNDLRKYALGKGRHVLCMATYHYSKGDPHRGCAGHGYDTEKSISCSTELVKQLDFYFAVDPLRQVYNILVGVETDCEALVFHGRNGKTISMADIKSIDGGELMATIKDLYPDMPQQVAHDLIPLMAGNIEHVRDLGCKEKSHVELEHMERILAIGQGFDWLHKINYALIINDTDPQLNQSIATAAKIIKANRDAGRISKESAVLFASVSYFDETERNGAIMNARYLTKLGLETIKQAHPDLEGYFKPLTTVMHWDTRKLEVID
ncbi:MAG: hypothetical protein WC866_01890 [Patescibacteria group bacterium]|jgi:hypothetical protein